MGDEAVAKVLREAADLIETEGWVQGTFGGPGEGYCAVGAIRWVAGRGMPEGIVLGTTAINALAETLPPRFKAWPVSWNDYPGRKAGSVIRHLRKVAQSLEEN